MSMLPISPSPQPMLQALREVRVHIAAEKLEQVRFFYEELLRFMPWPPQHQIPGGWGVGDPTCGLYLQLRHDPKVDPVRRRCTLVVASLDELLERLGEYGWPAELFHGLGVADRWLALADPDGNLLEVRQEQRL